MKKKYEKKIDLFSALKKPRVRKTAAQILKQTQQPLEKKGWLEMGYLYVRDEPCMIFFPQLKEEFEFVKKHAPKIKILCTFNDPGSLPYYSGTQFTPAYSYLKGVVDIWVPMTHVFCPKFLDKRRKKGDETWSYVCIGTHRPFAQIWGIDFKGVKHRILFWQLFQHNISGFLYWATTYWKVNPFKNPMTYPRGNGDGSLVYPGPEGPITSIRWELIREGIEDYDYLMMLKTKIKKLKNPKAIRYGLRLLNLKSISKNFYTYTTDHCKLKKRRNLIADFLEGH